MTNPTRLTARGSRLTAPATIAALVLLTAVAMPVTAEQTRPSVKEVFDSLESVHHVYDVAISKDGGSVAWSERAKDAKGVDRLGRLFVSAPAGSKPRRLTGAAEGKDAKEKDAAFSPDGSRVAFISDAGSPGQSQIWVAETKSGAPKRLTSVKGQIDHLLWSPDGRSIALLFVEGSSQETGALVAHKRDAGVVAETPEIQRIAIADAKTGRIRSVSPEKLFVYDYDWSPDGRSFAAEAAVGSGTDNYWLAELYVVDAASGEARSIWKPKLQIAWPRFSPDGKWVAAIHGIMSDQGSDGGDVWVAPVDGGEARNLTPDMPASAKTIAWRSDGTVQFGENVDGEGGVARVDPKGGKVETVWRGPMGIHKIECAAGGACVAALDSYSKPPEVYAGRPGAWKPVTSMNPNAKAWWGEARSLHWKSDGATVQGWLIAPLERSSDPNAKAPMVVVAHGGPSGASVTGWPARSTAILPSQGYYVFLPNPRGSFGFGEAFTAGNVKDFGGGDLRDIMSGVDEVLRTEPIDPKRLGLSGWSYGGYMAMWAVTQTDRFAAAVAGAGIASWQSYYGQNKIDRWMLPFFGASVYDDPKVYAKSSPIEFIKNVKTPTLVLHGERDSEVPTPQGYEFWHALKTLGVPTELVIYTDEGHGIRDPKHQLDIVERSVQWFDKYLRSSSQSAAAVSSK
ncbi:MAG TPA: S9 family peptidase [Thermoanaerobaculia bacterium]|nr:S9 family peptidase [Thermoanaerobaculia bacterium]